MRPNSSNFDLIIRLSFCFQKTKVLLNVYDLSPANDYLFPVGLGLHHSGVEIDAREYSFGSGGGIFEGPPKEAGGARFRFQIDMGAYDGGLKELNQALDDLRSSGFGAADYNLVRKNCNHFCQALCWRLLQRSIPAYVNRLADLGNCCSCLLPKQMLEDSPVGGSGNRTAASSFLVPTNASMSRGNVSSTTSVSVFAGKGYSLGGSAAGGSTEGLLSSWTRTQAVQGRQDDLTDRREKARMAAMARMEQTQASSKETHQN